jgi:hypothetical protein
VLYSLGQHLNTLHTLCQASESPKSSKNWTYEGNHAADEFRDSVQTISSQNFFVGEFGTEREVSESQEVDIFMIGVVSLDKTSLASRLNESVSCNVISGKRRAKRS